VQLAWLEYDEHGECIESRSAIIKPHGFTIPLGATEVHGITTERAATEGIEPASVLMEFASAVARSRLLVAHNMSFDEKIVGAELLRAGIASRLFDIARFCTMKTTASVCAIPNRYGFKWPTLSELHLRLFGSVPRETHSADADVQACANCFFELKRSKLITISD
jgi:DNA polymerase III epsilon subunit-like protein